jgi:hypothetical protein
VHVHYVRLGTCHEARQSMGTIIEGVISAQHPVWPLLAVTVAELQVNRQGQQAAISRLNGWQWGVVVDAHA